MPASVPVGVTVKQWRRRRRKRLLWLSRHFSRSNKINLAIYSAFGVFWAFFGHGV